jgi:hypothetical protein
MSPYLTYDISAIKYSEEGKKGSLKEDFVLPEEAGVYSCTEETQAGAGMQ